MNDDIVKKLKDDAFSAARATPIPKNPKTFLLSDEILALSDDFFYGRKQPPPHVHKRVLEIFALADQYYRGERKPTPRARAIARKILAHVERINSRRKTSGFS
jgi:hypothetical protein